jgi:hypothetical protein
MQQLQVPGENITLKLGGSTYRINRKEIERATEIVEFASTLESLEMPLDGFGMTSSLDLRRYEGAYSSIFAVALDRLCTAIVADRLYKGVVLHQGPVQKRKSGAQGIPETADMLGIVLKKPGVSATPVFVSDLKISNDKVAMKETALYSNACAQVSHNQPNKHLVTIGLSGSTCTLTMTVNFVGLGSKVSLVPVIEKVPPTTA